MSKTCSGVAGRSAKYLTVSAITLASVLAISSVAHAASIGHSRLLSAPGEPLAINVPLRDLSPSDQQVLRVRPAPISAWHSAALVPPVDLATMQISIEPGFTPDSRVVHVRSSHPFDGPVADLLLQVDTAAGSRQYQVSLLSQADPAGRIPWSAPSGVGVSGQSAVGAPRTSQASAIHVKRGDTMFVLARAHAVEGVTVYQMMIALQRANPQAFIEGNINLVKAGATLAIPDATALRAISDREARRIFQQHVQAYAAYRDRIAARRGAVVQSDSAQQGTVSSSANSVVATPPVALGDQVVLSSAPQDALQDQQEATRRNIQESEARVSQLERNVQSLSKALQMQGEAAKDAVLDGAAAVGQGITEAASSLGLSDGTTSSSDGEPVGGSSGSETATSSGAAATTAASASSAATDAALSNGSAPSANANAGVSQPGVTTDASDGSATQTGVTAQPGSSTETSSASTSESSTESGATSASESSAETGATSASGSSAGIDATSTADSTTETSASAASESETDATGATAAEASTDALNSVGTAASTTGTSPSSSAATTQSEGAAAKNSAASSTSSGFGSTSSAGGVSIDTGSAPASSTAASQAAQDSSGAQTSAAEPSSESSKAEQPVSWFQENFLIIITGILALVVLIIAWLLRRAGASRGSSGQGVVTEAMVQERLETIDLDLGSPPADQRSTRSS